MIISTKRLPWIGLGLLVFLVLSTQMKAHSGVIEQAKQYFTQDEIDSGRARAMQYLWIWWASTLAQFAMLVYLAFKPLGRNIYLKTGELVHGHWFSHLILLAASVIVALAAVRFPFSLARYFLGVSWGMVNLSFVGWLWEWLLSNLINGIGEMVVILGLYGIMRYSDRLWWVFAGAASVLFGYFVAFIVPDVVEPLFNTLTPIGQTEWKLYEPRIRGMASRVDFAPSNIFVADASRQSNYHNAHFTGFGSTQRIVLDDNLLKNFSQDEAFTVIAHELGHYWERHIMLGILYGGLALTAGLFLLSAHLNALVEAGTLRRPSDPAGLFRIVLIAKLALVLTMPVQNGMSRLFERQADAQSLELSRNPQAFISAEIKLAKQNKSDVAPSGWNVLLFSTHPSVLDRIKMAEQWQAPSPKK